MPPRRWWISAQVKPKRMSRPRNEPKKALATSKASGPGGGGDQPPGEEQHAEIERPAGDAVQDRHHIVISGRKIVRCGESGREAPPARLQMSLGHDGDTHTAARQRRQRGEFSMPRRRSRHRPLRQRGEEQHREEEHRQDQEDVGEGHDQRLAADACW